MQKALWLLLGLLGAAAPLSAQSVPESAEEPQIEFRTPSGNIYCEGDYLNEQGRQHPGLTCMVLQREGAALPKPASCDLDWTPTVELKPNGAARHSGLCTGDIPFNPSAKVLPYGESIKGQGWRCTAMSNGLRCENRSGRGFHLSRRAQQLF